MSIPKYRSLTFAIFVVGLCCLSSLYAQNQNPNATTLSVLEGLHIISVVPWAEGSHDLLAVISERSVTVGQETGPIRVLTIYRKEGRGLIKILAVETLDTFAAAFPLNETGGRLFVAWTAGSAYHFAVYTSAAGNVKQILEGSSRGMPEFVVNQSESESILISKKIFVNGEWRRTDESTTDVYSWDGARYEAQKDVPWKDRLTIAAKAH
jgi:hypothetical protein